MMEQQFLSDEKETQYRSVETYRQPEVEEVAVEQEALPVVKRESQSVEVVQQEALLATLSQEASRYRRKRRYIILGVSTYFLVMGIVAAAEWVQNGHFPHQMVNVFSSMTGLIGGFVSLTKKHKAAATQIAQFENIHAIGPLANELDFVDADVRRIVEKALTNLLPKLKSSDASLLTAEQSSKLIHALNRPHPELSLAILEALKQIGDERALPTVQKLAQGEGPAAKNLTLQQAAQDCLPTLIARSENRLASAQLLRAANGNETSADVLLRPATGTSVETDTATLLRIPEMPHQ